jgi:hypothetical protein
MLFSGSRRIAVVGVLILGLVATPAAPSFATEVAPPETVMATMDDLEEAPDAAPDDGSMVSEELDATVPFSMIGLTLPDGVAAADVRTRGLDGAWSAWESLEVEVAGIDGPDLGTEEARNAAPNVTSPLWVGAADGFEVRIDGELADVEATLLDTEGLNEGVLAKVSRHLTPRVVTPAAEAATGGPEIISRQAWGADESIRRSSPRYAEPTFMVLHHTAGSNYYSRSQSAGVVRGVYSYHTVTRGWADIGYNVMVDKYGQIFEGRYGGLERGVIGAHAAGFNTGSFGVSVLGNYDVVKAPQVALDAVAEVTAWKYGLHDIDPDPAARVVSGGRSLRTMTAHREVGSTACPGRYLYAEMDGLRTQIAAMAAASVVVPEPEPAPTPTGEGPIPVPGDWNGDGRTQTGWFDDGTWVLPSGPSGATERFSYGRAGDTPVVGDWDGDGKDGIGVRRVGRWYLRNTPTPGAAELNFINGYGSDLPVVGDWDGDGRDGVGVYRDGRWRLRQTASGGYPDMDFYYGGAGDRPITGDWDGDGHDGIGHVAQARWHLRDVAGAGSPTHVFDFARPDDHRVAGDFNGDGRDSVGVVRGDGWLISTDMPAQPADYVLRFDVESQPEPASEVEPEPVPEPQPQPEPIPTRTLTWYLRFVNSGGAADAHARQGNPGDLVLACDFDGDGRDTPASFRDGRWTISNASDGRGTLTSFTFGRSGDLPLCGDWNGDGRATVAVVRSDTWYFKNRLEGGGADHTARYGRVADGDKPIVGDWNGDGRDTLGIIRDGQWHLRNDLAGGPGSISFSYGRILRGDLPLIGDWNGNGRDGVGIVRGGEWHLRNHLSGGPAQEEVFTYGRITAGDVPVVGDWNGNGRSSPGIVR